MHIFLYLDPGTGSIILQLIAAGAGAVVLFSKKAGNKISDAFRYIKGIFKRKQN